MQRAFEYLRPKTRREAQELLAHPDYRAIPLIVRPKPSAPRRQGADAIIDLSLLELDAIQAEPDGSVHIGALATLQAMIESPLLARGGFRLLGQAAGLAAGPGIRNLAGLWGAIEPPYGSPELLLALLVLEAKIVILETEEKKPIVSFQEYLTTQTQSNQKNGLVLEAVVPALDSCGWALERVARTPRDEAITAVAAIVTIEHGTARQVRLALGGANPSPLRLYEVEKNLAGRVFDVQTLQSAAEAAMELTEPTGDFRGSADYRRAMAGVVVHRALIQAWKNAQ